MQKNHQAFEPNFAIFKQNKPIDKDKENFRSSIKFTKVQIILSLYLPYFLIPLRTLLMYNLNGYLFCYLIYFYVFSVPLRLCGKLPPERLLTFVTFLILP
ncbi:MAG: hypothetical protein AB1414_09030 [bacterium]